MAIQFLPLLLKLAPLLIGAGVGAATDKKPAKGALKGAAIGGLTGGLGKLFGAGGATEGASKLGSLFSGGSKAAGEGAAKGGLLELFKSFGAKGVASAEKDPLGALTKVFEAKNILAPGQAPISHSPASQPGTPLSSASSRKSLGSGGGQDDLIKKLLESMLRG